VTPRKEGERKEEGKRKKEKGKTPTERREEQGTFQEVHANDMVRPGHRPFLLFYQTINQS